MYIRRGTATHSFQDHDLVGTLQDLDWKQTIRNHETDRSHRLTRPGVSVSVPRRPNSRDCSAPHFVNSGVGVKGLLRHRGSMSGLPAPMPMKMPNMSGFELAAVAYLPHSKQHNSAHKGNER